MSTTMRQQLTAGEFAALPTEGLRLELVRGELRAMPPTFSDHGGVAMSLSILVGHYIKSQRLGKCYAAETGFLIARNPDTVRAPDFAFIQASRVTSAATASAWNTVIPDLVVEVVSSGDRASEIGEKVQMWLDAGVRLVWVAYPVTRQVAIHHTGQAPQTLTAQDTLDGEDVVPGFSAPVADIFA